jgi:hypothetical protein
VSTTTELVRVKAELDALRAAVSALADEAIAGHERHLHVTRRSAPDHRPCESGARAMFAKRLRALLEGA